MDDAERRRIREERRREREVESEKKLTDAVDGAKGCIGFLAFTVVASLAVWGCASIVGVVRGDDEPDGPQTFAQAVEAGWSCAELYRWRNAQEPGWSGREDADATLHQLGCTHPDAERQSTTAPPAPVPVPAECAEAMRATAQEYSSAPEQRLEHLIRRSLDSCSDRDVWTAALRRHPGAAGVVDARYLSGDEVEWRCQRMPDTRVCRAR